jgi:hypothetical protein
MEYLEGQIVKGVKNIESIPIDIKTVMIRALQGALDFVIHDISPEGQAYINFFDLLPEFGFQAGELIQKSLKELDYITESNIDEIMTAVGMQFANTEGPDFERLTTLPSLVLMEGQQIAEVMSRVGKGITEGISLVVYNLNMEEKYQRAAMRALENGMRMVGKQFEGYMAAGAGGMNGDSTATGPGTDPNADTGFWEPPRFDTEICCMPGMACWTGDFANAAGRASIVE